MKQILIILGLFASVTTFAQSPRIKLNQITKDTVKGSVLISSPSDSGMVYSRDFYIAYGADTVLILYGDTLAATSGIISSVLSDGVTITGDGTTGNELKVDTLLIATIKALNDTLATISASTTPDGVTITGDGSVGNPLKVDTLLIATIKALNDTLATISASTTPDGVTITGDGSVGNPLKVDTATVISTIQGLVDTLTNRGYLTANQTITISGDVTGSGTTSITATVVDDSHDHIISNVDFLQDSLNAKANDSDLANYVTIAGADTITGAKTFTNTFTQSGGDANFDNNTLYVDESANSIGIGTSSPTAGYNMEISGSRSRLALLNTSGNTSDYSQILFGNGIYTGEYAEMIRFNNTKEWSIYNQSGDIFFSTNVSGGSYRYDLFIEESNGNVGIGTGSPSEKLDVNGNARFRSIGSGASAGALHYTSTGVLTTNTSDARLKTNLQPLENTLNKLLGINTYTFNWIDETDRVDLGMIAQEVEQMFPNLVFTNNVDGYKGIHYDKFSSILTKAIQEQQAIIETQQSEIDELKTLITDLTNRLTILENK